MTKSPEPAALAELTQRVSELQTQMEAVREGQQSVVAVLTLLVETNEAQSEMLAEILAAARQDQGPSETAQQLDVLTVAIRQNSDVIQGLAQQMAALPTEIGAEVARAMPGAPSGPALP